MISKKKLVLMALMVMSLGVTSASLAAAPTAAAKSTPASAYTQGVPSAKEKSNPFGLVYDGAITKNVKGQVNIRPVHYDLNGITVAANVYLPADYDEKSPKLYPAITVAHPNGGDKEQVAGLFAQKLAEAGYITIAADASYQGASTGTPRLRDYPSNRINDISGMVDYLEMMPKVDHNRIGSLGICGGGGYTLAASQTDKRIKAVAALSMFNSGRVRRNGFQDKQIATIQQRLADASEARNEELKGNVEYVGFLPPHKDDNELRKIMEAQPEGIYKDGIDYYGLSYRSSRATGSYTKESFLKLMAFDVEDHMDLINQPLLMVAGSAADTLYMTEDAFKKAVNAKDKELYLIPGASHIKTYWQPDFVKQELAKFEEFFGKNL